MPNPENIVPHKFKKGESGNLIGRPPGIRNRQTIYAEIADLAISALKIDIDHLPPNTDVAKATAIQVFRKAIIEGDVHAAREAFDSAYGKNADVLNADITSTLSIVDAQQVVDDTEDSE